MKHHDFSHKTKAFEHQINAISLIKGDHPVALFDEPGLGKSKMVIAGLVEDMKNKLIDCALIVCKKTLVSMWGHEIKTHSNLTYTKLVGTSSERRKYYTNFSHFYIISYDLLMRDEQILSELLHLKKGAIVLDESHRIKNPESNITKALFRLRKYSKKNIIITGTPVANTPVDLWAQFYFLDGGTSFGADFREFKKEYGIEIGMGKNKINQENLKRLQEKIKELSIRRTKVSVTPNLPSKKYNYLYVDLKGRQKDNYDSLRTELAIEIENMDGEMIQDQADNILKRFTRLIQIASNPYLIDSSYKEEPAKFRLLDKLVQKIVKKGEKVIIWSSFVKNIILLKRRYAKYNSLTLFGKMEIKDRDKVVKWFQEDPAHKVLVANPAAAKEGLTLTAANNAIYIDRNFNINDYVQSQDRIHRISQKKQCNITIIIARNTVDEYVEEILMKKHEIASLVQGDTDQIQYPKELLTKEKVLSILGGRVK